MMPAIATRIMETATDHLHTRVISGKCGAWRAKQALSRILRCCGRRSDSRFAPPKDVLRGCHKAARHSWKNGSPGVEEFENAVRKWADDLARDHEEVH